MKLITPLLRMCNMRKKDEKSTLDYLRVLVI
jgi:hypothetical protein